MAKNLKLNIKNDQIANAVNLSGFKDKLANKKAVNPNKQASDNPSLNKPQQELKEAGQLQDSSQPKAHESKLTESNATKQTKSVPAKKEKASTLASKEKKNSEPEVEVPRVRARSRSVFADPSASPKEEIAQQEMSEPEEFDLKQESSPSPSIENDKEPSKDLNRRKTTEELRNEIFGQEIEEQREQSTASSKHSLLSPLDESVEPIVIVEPLPIKPVVKVPLPVKPAVPSLPPRPNFQQRGMLKPLPRLEIKQAVPREFAAPIHKLGPTGKHVKDLIPPPRPKPPEPIVQTPSVKQNEDDKANKPKVRARDEVVTTPANDDKKGLKGVKFKEFRDVKPPIKRTDNQRFDARDKQGLRESEEDGHRRRKRTKQLRQQEDLTIRPTTLKTRIPISIKDLASEMKLKASQLIAKLFVQGIVVTLNDLLEDPTTIQLLGHEFGCEIEIDTSEEQRIRVTDKTIREEVQGSSADNLVIRPPVVAFMGHVDHGKTSLIDAIRKSNRASGEAGAITQHIGAFRCSTPVGDIAILDTPGHEAFSAMRERGADVTDIVVLVIAGDEGMRQQTIEAMNQAKAANVTIVVAINKCDKPTFNVDNVYRQLSENGLLPESWGGQTITINCSATTGEGISQLLEMLALQAEILELKADPTYRARGTVLESELHKGMGSIATVLIQNGTLHCGDAVVFGQHWGKIKTMRNEFGQELSSAGPSTPVEITGLSGLPEAGEEFIVVKSEKEARAISDVRAIGIRQVNFLQSKKISMDHLVQKAGEATKKMLNLILRADVQGSLEALKAVLTKITSTKAELNIISAGVGEVSESDVQLAATSKATIIGFHTQIESHADALMKELGIQVRLHNVIYHAIDDVKVIMRGLLDKIAQDTEKGKADVKATFKSSHHGVIVGCIVTEGSIHRAHSVRIKRGTEIVWKGSILSLKRVKEDVREVIKGLECGIVLKNFNEALEGDIIETYETTYITQEL